MAKMDLQKVAKQHVTKYAEETTFQSRYYVIAHICHPNRRILARVVDGGRQEASGRHGNRNQRENEAAGSGGRLTKQNKLPTDRTLTIPVCLFGLLCLCGCKTEKR